MFFGNVSLTKLSLPCSAIGKNAFYACSNLKEVELSGKVKLDEGAFRSCTSLNKVYMSGNVYEIGSRAFEGCTALRVLVLPNCSTKIGTDAFYRCDELTTVGVQQNTLLNIGESFRECAKWENIVVANLTQENGEYTIDLRAARRRIITK
jgi:hypothetical protein